MLCTGTAVVGLPRSGLLSEELACIAVLVHVHVLLHLFQWSYAIVGSPAVSTITDAQQLFAPSLLSVDMLSSTIHLRLQAPIGPILVPSAAAKHVAAAGHASM